MDVTPLWVKWLVCVLVVLLLLMFILMFYQRRVRAQQRARHYIKLLELQVENLQQKNARLKKELEAFKQLPSITDLSGKKAFISYSNKDYNIVLALRQLLEQQGVPCFMAPESIPPGSDYTEVIPDAICDAFATVVVLSSASQDSTWVTKEVRLSIEKNIPVIPYQIDASKLTRQFSFLLGQCQYIPFSEDPGAIEKANNELVNRLIALKSVAEQSKE